MVKNEKLAHEYKVIQTKEMAIKDTMAGFYESRVALEATKVWFAKLINMENRYFGKTSEINKLRDELHTAEYQNLQKANEEHVGWFRYKNLIVSD